MKNGRAFFDREAMAGQHPLGPNWPSDAKRKYVTLSVAASSFYLLGGICMMISACADTVRSVMVASRSIPRNQFSGGDWNPAAHGPWSHLAARSESVRWMSNAAPQPSLRATHTFRPTGKPASRPRAIRRWICMNWSARATAGPTHAGSGHCSATSRACVHRVGRSARA